jgi:hypothetical protein
MAVDRQDGFGKGLGRFLRQIVTDAAGEIPVLIFARELREIRCRGACGAPFGITFKGDREYGNGRTFGKSFFQIVVFRLTLGDAVPSCAAAMVMAAVPKKRRRS